MATESDGTLAGDMARARVAWRVFLWALTPRRWRPSASPAQRCPTCIHPEGYDRLSGPCPTCNGDGVIPPVERGGDE